MNPRLPSFTALMLCAISFLVPARAATFSVSNTNDAGEGSLRQALSEANSSPDEDIIAFDAAAFASPQTIRLSTGELNVAQNVSIVGPGARQLTLSGNGKSRVFNVASDAAANLSGFTISAGFMTYSALEGSSPVLGRGGGILNAGNLSLANCNLKGNIAQATASRGGGIYNIGTARVTGCSFIDNFSSEGGGIYNNGTLSIDNSTITLNRAQAGSGIFNAATLTLQNSTIYCNNTNVGNAGLVNAASGTLEMSSTIVALNSDFDLSGTVNSGDYNLVFKTTGATLSGTHNITGVNPKLGDLADNGGPTDTYALLPGSAAIDAGNSTLASDQRGLVRPADDATVANAVGGNGADIGAFEVRPATQKGRNFIVNNASDSGDGVCDAKGTGDGCTLREAITAANTGVWGAGQVPSVSFDSVVFSSSKTIALRGSQLTISRDMQIVGNGPRLINISANNRSRVLYVMQGTVGISGLKLSDGIAESVAANSSWGGGAIYTYGTLTLSNCLISNNRAIARGAYSSAIGGGIFNGGVLTVNQCTFSENSTEFTDSNVGNAVGGAIGNISTATVSNSTFVGNRAIWNGGRNGGAQGGAIGSRKSLTLTGSTLSGNLISGGIDGSSGGADVHGLATVSNCIFNESAQSLGGGVGDGGYNIARDNGGGILRQSSNRINTDPQLDPRGLQDNGGLTDTIALLPGSPAIDAGNIAYGTDQRGARRPLGVASDIGAFEYSTFSESLVVTTLSDEDNGTSEARFGNGTSLREAVLYGNAQGGGTITFAPGLQGDIALYNSLDVSQPVTIVGPGAKTISITRATSLTGQSFRLINVTATATISGFTISGGNTSSSGGAVRVDGGATLTMSRCALTNNFGGAGGAIDVARGILRLEGCTLSDNRASGRGGAINVGSQGRAELVNCTLWRNTSPFEPGAIDNAGILTLSNCTVTGNIAQKSGGAGGIYNVGTTSLGTPQLTLSNSIIADNGANDIVNNGHYSSGDYNLLGVVQGVTTLGSNDQSGVTAAQLRLGLLNDNGGQTPTLALQEGSLALNAGDPAFDGTDKTDQRGTGFTRVRGKRLDVGAFEVQNVSPVITSAAVTPAVPKTNDELKSQPSILDGDGNTLTYTYVWKKNGAVLENEKGDSLDLSKAGNGNKGDVISYIVSVDDGHGGTASKEFAGVTIVNSAPSITGVRIHRGDDPTFPTTRSYMNGLSTITDADGDTITKSYNWRKNGQLMGRNSSSLPLEVPGNGDRGDQLSFLALASDGTDTSSAESASVTVLNTPPTAFSLRMTGGYVTNSVLALELFNSTDDDADSLTTSYQWKKNDVVLEGELGDTLDLGKEGNGSKGDIISVVVTRADGHGGSVTAQTSINIEDSPALPTSVTISPISPKTNDILKATVIGSDPDGDTPLYWYKWLNNGVPVGSSEESDTLDLSLVNDVMGFGDKGDTITLNVTPRFRFSPAVTASTTIINSAPILTAKSFKGHENQEFASQIVGNDVDKDVLTYSVKSTTLNGTLVLQSSGAFTYTPKLNWNGSDSFSALVVDSSGETTAATFSLDIAPTNSTPVAVADAIKGTEDVSFLIPTSTLLSNDQSGENEIDTLRVVRVDAPAGFPGTLKFDLELQTIVFTPKLNWNGTTLFTYTVQDSGGDTATSQVTIQVAPVNDAPVAQSSNFTGRENQLLQGQVRATDVEGEALTFGLSSTPRFGTLVFNPNGSFSYTPRANWNGSDSFSFRATDGAKAASTPATISLTVLPTNGAPVAVADVMKGVEDVPLSIPASTLLKNDTNGENLGESDVLRIIKVAGQSGFPGTLTFDIAKQIIVFTARLNWSGTTTFTYTVQDSGGVTATAQVTLQIAPVNDAPVATPGKLTVISGTLGEVALTGTDVEGDVLAFALSGRPTNGGAQIVKVGDRWFLRYQSKAGFSGTDTLSFIARDGKLNSAPATITITVKPNSPPLLLSVLPNRGTFPAGSTIVFEQKVRDLDGVTHLDATALLIGNSATSATSRDGATLWFDAQSNAFTLTKDDGSATFAPVALGQTLENSQVKVTLAARDVVRTTTGILTLRWLVTFKPNFVGTKSLWSRAEDMGSLSAGFTKSGDITLTASTKALSSSAPTS